MINIFSKVTAKEPDLKHVAYHVYDQLDAYTADLNRAEYENRLEIAREKVKEEKCQAVLACRLALAKAKLKAKLIDKKTFNSDKRNLEDNLIYDISYTLEHKKYAMRFAKIDINMLETEISFRLSEFPELTLREICDQVLEWAKEKVLKNVKITTEYL